MGKRVFWIVLDSAGIGGAPDAAEFGDFGADTFGTCYRSGALDVPYMTKMGLFNIVGTSFYNPKEDINGCFCRILFRIFCRQSTRYRTHAHGNYNYGCEDPFCQ